MNTIDPNSGKPEIDKFHTTNKYGIDILDKNAPTTLQAVIVVIGHLQYSLQCLILQA